MKPVHIDAGLYVAIAVCGFIATILGSDEAFKLLPESVLFWAKLGNGALLAAATALKMFRSTQYATHLQNTVNGSGEIVRKIENERVTHEPDKTLKVTSTETVVETKPKLDGGGFIGKPEPEPTVLFPGKPT